MLFWRNLLAPRKCCLMLLEGWESLGSAAHTSHWQKLLGVPGVGEIQRRKINEMLLNSNYNFQEMLLVKLWVRDLWGISTMPLCCWTGKHLKIKERNPDVDLARSSMDVLRFLWNTEIRALVGVSCNEPNPLSALALLCDSQNLLGGQMKWYSLVVPHCKHFHHWGIFIFNYYYWGIIILQAVLACVTTMRPKH